jgi:signal transduction histidine kinase
LTLIQNPDFTMLMPRDGGRRSTFMGYTERTGLDPNLSRIEETSHPRTADPALYSDLEQTLRSIQDLLRVEWLALLIPSPDRTELLPVSTVGFPAHFADTFRLSMDEAAQTQLRPELTPVLVEDPSSHPTLSPLCSLDGVRSVTIVPLALNGQLQGILHFGSRKDHGDDGIEPSVIRLIAHTASLAVERAELKQAEAQANKASLATRDKLTFLAVASGLLSSSLDYETTLGQITGMLVPRLADVCSVVLLDDYGSVNQITIDGVDPTVTRLVQELQTRYSLRPGSNSTVRRVLDTGETEFHPSLNPEYFEDIASNEDHLDLLRQLSFRSMVIVPLSRHGTTIGALSLAYTTDKHRYTTDDVDFIEEIANRAALAVENARLYRESQRALEEREEALSFRDETLLLEREARARAEIAQRREAFLSEASSVLSMSLDYTSTLDDLARLVVSRLADWCSIELFDDNGTSSLAAAAHAKPDGEAILERIREEYLPATIPELPPRHVLRYREPTLINNLPGAFWFDSAATPEHLILLDALETTALIIVPLFARNRTMGIMMLGRVKGTDPFLPDDVPMAIDLGYRVALATENSRLYNRAQSVVQQREEFISTASHELKTPLTTVKGYLQLINRQLHREDFSPERLVRFTSELDDQVRRLEDLVSDLLDVSRIQQGRLELRLERFDLAELASSVLSRFEHAPERMHNHELTLMAPEPIEGIWDSGRLDQVLTNLISNALKYSPDGGQVIVHVRRVGDSAQIAVRDSGIGITPEEKANLFQPFSRGRNIRPKISGTGLGLYITQRIVANHQGRIFVKSDPGHGTTFIVQLPIETEP